MKKNVLKNIISLYGFSIAKVLFPFISLFYLTRTLSVDTYGVLSYVKTTCAYMQLLVDFGFMLSGTKDIVSSREDNKQICEISSEIFTARAILTASAFVCLLILSFALPLLRNYRLFTLLSFVPVFCSIFLFDYIFQGLGKMHVNPIRFIIMKGIAVLLTIALVKSDEDILLIPLLDIAGSVLAMILVRFELKKLDISIHLSRFSNAWMRLKESAVYFLSEMAASIFSAFNTLLIGIFLSPSDVAYWSICIMIISAVNILMNPIIDGVYPDMVRTKDLNQIKKLLITFMPIVTIGCMFMIFAAKYILLIAGGEKYIDAAMLLRLLVPVLFFCFPAMLLGWPTLGAIGKQKSVTNSTIISACFQLLGLFVLALFGKFTLISIALLRVLTEIVLLSIRCILCYKNRTLFA